MSKKSFIIFIIFILIVMGVLGWYFIIRTENLPTSDSETETSSSDLFPFGNKPSTKETENGGLVTTPGDETNRVINLGGPNGGGDDNGEVLPRLRQISTVPTAGAINFDA